jgi:hypothetical protein
MTQGKLKSTRGEWTGSSGLKEKGYGGNIITISRAQGWKAEVNSGFTVAGRVFEMSTPEKVTEAGQAL